MTTQPTEQSMDRRKNERLTTAVLSLNSAIEELEKLQAFADPRKENYSFMLEQLRFMRENLHK